MYVEDLLAKDEIDRVEKLTDERVRMELLVAGIARVPTAAELLAGIGERAQRRPDPARGWMYVASLPEEDQQQARRAQRPRENAAASTTRRIPVSAAGAPAHSRPPRRRHSSSRRSHSPSGVLASPAVKGARWR
jgi:hypothetical protein